MIDIDADEIKEVTYWYCIVHASISVKSTAGFLQLAIGLGLDSDERFWGREEHTLFYLDTEKKSATLPHTPDTHSKTT